MQNDLVEAQSGGGQSGHDRPPIGSPPVLGGAALSSYRIPAMYVDHLHACACVPKCLCIYLSLCVCVCVSTCACLCWYGPSCLCSCMCERGLCLGYTNNGCLARLSVTVVSGLLNIVNLKIVFLLFLRLLSSRLMNTS